MEKNNPRKKIAWEFDDGRMFIVEAIATPGRPENRRGHVDQWEPAESAEVEITKITNEAPHPSAAECEPDYIEIPRSDWEKNGFTQDVVAKIEERVIESLAAAQDDEPDLDR